MWFKKVKEIKNSEAFDSFEWKGPDLNKFNLIYGWNGSGKTTTSRVFGSVEKGAVVAELGETQFQILTDGKPLKNADLGTPSPNIRVFNDDFVKEHLKFHESKTKQILIAGKTSIETEEEIKLLTEKQKDLERQQKELTTARGKFKPLEDILTQAGSEVVKKFADTPLGNSDYSGRKYNRTQVQKHLADHEIRGHHSGRREAHAVSRHEASATICEIPKDKRH